MLIYTKDDQQYVEELYLELKDDMFYVANKILQNESDAEDAIHLAFVNIIKKALVGNNVELQHEKILGINNMIAQKSARR